jgi:hypothetical protein
MKANHYNQVTHWHVRGRVEEIYDQLYDATDLPRWWPSVYREVRQLTPNDATGTGSRFTLRAAGWLPYTIRFQFQTMEAQRPSRLALQARGDLTGEGIFTLAQDGEWANVTYDWLIEADKPILRYFSFILKPLFATNHRWTMERGLESLQRELARRHAAPGPEQVRIAPTPARGGRPLRPLLGLAALALAGWAASRTPKARRLLEAGRVERDRWLGPGPGL